MKEKIEVCGQNSEIKREGGREKDGAGVEVEIYGSIDWGFLLALRKVSIQDSHYRLGYQVNSLGGMTGGKVVVRA